MEFVLSRTGILDSNPAIWWVSISAMLFYLGCWLTRRDWRAGASLVGIIAGWLPWFLFLKRTDHRRSDHPVLVVVRPHVVLGLDLVP